MHKLLYAILLVPIFAFSQMRTDWGAFTQRLSATSIQGKKFRIEAAVRVEGIDPAAQGQIWVRVDREKKKTGFFYNMTDKPITSANWKVYTIEGKIEKDAEWINFGGLYHRSGRFYFDDFKLLVETSKGQFTEVPIGEHGFESDANTINKYWKFLQEREGYKANPSETLPYSGKQSFYIDGSWFISPKTFGNNNDAGNYVDLNGVKLYYEKYGSGPPLLLLHGNSESISSFSKQIPELSKQFTVIALDTRGQGNSTENGEKFTYELFAADTKAFLDQLQLDSVNIIGWSDGGNIGLIMAMKYPSKVEKLAVMGANLFNNSSSVDKKTNKILKKELQSADTTIKGGDFRKRMFELLLYEPNINPNDLASISIPVLVMAGSKDVIKPAHTKLIATRIPRSQLVIFPDGTHYEPRENPGRFNETVLKFLLK